MKTTYKIIFLTITGSLTGYYAIHLMLQNITALRTVSTLLVAILALLQFAIIISYFIRDKNNRFIRKNATHPIRSIRQSELDYLYPYLNAASSTLFSDDVYRVQGIVQTKVYKSRRSNISQVSVVINGMPIFFPYDLSLACRGYEDIEYVIVTHASGGLTLVALTVNQQQIVTSAQNMWQTQEPASKVISQHLENAQEYQIRRSAVNFPQSLFFFALALIALLVASYAETSIVFYTAVTVAIFCVFAMLYMCVRLIKHHKAPRMVQTVRGMFKLMGLGLQNQSSFFIPSLLIGPRFLIMNSLTNLGINVGMLENKATLGEADIVLFNEKRQQYFLYSADSSLVTKSISDNSKRPNGRLKAYSIVACLALVFFYKDCFDAAYTLVKYWGKSPNKTYLSGKAFVDNPPHIGTYITLSASNDLDTELENNKPVFDRIRVGATERLDLSVFSPIVLALYQGTYFNIEISNQRVRTGHPKDRFSPPSAYWVNAHKLNNASILTRYLDTLCEKQKSLDCSDVYADLIHFFSDKKNLYLNHQWKGDRLEPLTLDVFKRILAQDEIWVTSYTYNKMTTAVYFWLRASLSPTLSSIAKNDNRDGISLVLDGYYDAIENQIEKTPYSMAKPWVNAKHMQNTAYHFSGYVTDSYSAKGIKHIRLGETTRVGHRQVLASLAAIGLIILVMLCVLFSYLFPAKLSNQQSSGVIS